MNQSSLRAILGTVVIQLKPLSMELIELLQVVLNIQNTKQVKIVTLRLQLFQT